MKPFLKWAGGKHRLVDSIKGLLPRGRRLVEPFMGSGAVFLGLDFERYLLADANEDLVALYRFLQGDDVAAFIDGCEALFTPANCTAEAYYRLRAEFNELPRGDIRRAQLFVYMNKHSFNGLCRYSAQKQHFNVPFNQRKTPPLFPRKEMEGFAAKAVRAEFHHADFETTMQAAVPGDVLYVDPPYLDVEGQASNFRAYAPGGFSMEQQRKLAALCFECAERGVPVVLSNHDTHAARELYMGAHIVPLQVTRSISASGAKRGKADEVLVLFERELLQRGPRLPGLLEAA